MSANDRYLIILDKVREDLQPATAMFLSGCFSLPPASTKNIAASGPIALISDVSERQGEAVLAELNASAPEGVTLRLDKENSGAKVSRLQWPRPPRIFGRNLKEFEPSQPEPRCTDVNCPHCGGRVRIGLDQNGEIVVVGATPEVSPVCVTPPRPGSETDRDPLFAGIKPLAIDTSGYASLKSLQAGDTGFWTDLSNDLFAPQTQSVPGAQPNQPPPHMSAYTLEPKERQPLDSPAAPTADASRTSGSGSGSGGKRTGSSGGKSSTGLAAFMKPGAFSLVVGRTKDSQAVKMIAEIMGISEDEALEKSMNLSLCVARDISLDEAQNLMGRFQNTGAKARIVKPL